MPSQWEQNEAEEYKEWAFTFPTAQRKTIARKKAKTENEK